MKKNKYSETLRSSSVPPLLLTMKQAEEVLCLGHSKIYDLIRLEGLPVVRCGRAVRFSYAALQKWIEEKEHEHQSHSA